MEKCLYLVVNMFSISHRIWLDNRHYCKFDNGLTLKLNPHPPKRENIDISCMEACFLILCF